MNLMMTIKWNAKIARVDNGKMETDTFTNDLPRVLNNEEKSI